MFAKLLMLFSIAMLFGAFYLALRAPKDKPRYRRPSVSDSVGSGMLSRSGKERHEERLFGGEL